MFFITDMGIYIVESGIVDDMVAGESISVFDIIERERKKEKSLLSPSMRMYG